ncbi:hypothetical protein HDU76_007301, partial [Blyttiomyces sp. JEL0837]
MQKPNAKVHPDPSIGLGQSPLTSPPLITTTSITSATTTPAQQPVPIIAPTINPIPRAIQTNISAVTAQVQAATSNIARSPLPVNASLFYASPAADDDAVNPLEELLIDHPVRPYLLKFEDKQLENEFQHNHDVITGATEPPKPKIDPWLERNQPWVGFFAGLLSLSVYLIGDEYLNDRISLQGGNFQSFVRGAFVGLIAATTTLLCIGTVLIKTVPGSNPINFLSVLSTYGITAIAGGLSLYQRECNLRRIFLMERELSRERKCDIKLIRETGTEELLQLWSQPGKIVSTTQPVLSETDLLQKSQHSGLDVSETTNDDGVNDFTVRVPQVGPSNASTHGSSIIGRTHTRGRRSSLATWSMMVGNTGGRRQSYVPSMPSSAGLQSRTITTHSQSGSMLTKTRSDIGSQAGSLVSGFSLTIMEDGDEEKDDAGERERNDRELSVAPYQQRRKSSAISAYQNPLTASNTVKRNSLKVPESIYSYRGGGRRASNFNSLRRDSSQASHGTMTTLPAGELGLTPGTSTGEVGAQSNPMLSRNGTETTERKGSKDSSFSGALMRVISLNKGDFGGSGSDVGSRKKTLTRGREGSAAISPVTKSNTVKTDLSSAVSVTVNEEGPLAFMSGNNETGDAIQVNDKATLLTPGSSQNLDDD